MYWKIKLVRGRHSVGGSNYHFQLTPAYRRKVFENEAVREKCKEVVHEICNEHGFKLYAIEFGPDHVHIFIGNCKNYTVPEIVKLLKGRTSRVLRKELCEDLREYLWGKKFWSESYFYESVGNITSDAIKFYIERQQGKHWFV